MNKIDTAKKVKKDIGKVITEIETLQLELDKLNGAVQRNTDKYYTSQINALECRNELHNVINDIILLSNNVDSQSDKLGKIISSALFKLSSKRILTHIKWFTQKSGYSNGQLVIYRRGIGYIPSYGSNTVCVTSLRDVMGILYRYGDRLIELVPTKEKQEILSIITKFARMNKYKSIGQIDFKKHKCLSNTCVIDTDLSDNHHFSHDKVNSIMINNSTFNPPYFNVHFNVNHSYSSDSVYLSKSLSARNLYRIAINWSLIRDDMISIRDLLKEVNDGYTYIIKNLTVELSPYLLANAL